MEPEFNEEQIERYSRHIILKEIGGEGQKKLLGSSVLVVGAGGLGSPALLYLAAAGVGTLGVVDSDMVELSNLQRQIIHATGDLGKNKVLSAEESIGDLNPYCQLKTYHLRLRSINIRQVMRDYDVVLDGSDNFPTRFLVSDCCWLEKIPLVSAAALRFEGQMMTILPGEGNPCYHCFIPELPASGHVPRCQDAGVLGAVVGVMGSIQAVEAIKILLGIGTIMSHQLLVYDALGMSFCTIKRVPDPTCPLCSPGHTITQLVDYDLSC